METNFTIDDVIKAYFECRKKKQKTINALLYGQDWIENCVELHKEITDGTYQIGRSIAFAVTKPKLREIFAADFRDRIVHHLIVRRLEPLFEEVFIDDNYNCRKGKGVLYGFNRLHEHIRECSDNYTKKNCWILKCDMKGFFMSIHKPTLWNMLEKFIREKYKDNNIEQLLWLTKMVVLHSPENNCLVKGKKKLIKSLPKDKSLFTCGKDYGLPIGNLTSQMFANFYLTEFDHWMKERFKYYGRYVDDFYVIGENKQELLNILPEIREKLKPLHVTLHPNKIYLQHYTKGVKFIGSVSKKAMKYIGNRTVGNMYDALKELNSIKNKKEHVNEFLCRVNSYLGFLKQYNSYNIRKQLYDDFDNEWWKYIYVVESKKSIKVVLRKWVKEEQRNNLINQIRI